MTQLRFSSVTPSVTLEACQDPARRHRVEASDPVSIPRLAGVARGRVLSRSLCCEADGMPLMVMR